MKNLSAVTVQAITEFFNGLGVENLEVMDYLNIEEINFENAFESITEQLDENNAFDVEIVYYSSAIKYLQENDPSLTESLEIASDMGFEAKNLNSEILASLLATQNVRDDWYKEESTINDFFSELLEEVEEE